MQKEIDNKTEFLARKLITTSNEFHLNRDLVGLYDLINTVLEILYNEEVLNPDLAGDFNKLRARLWSIIKETQTK